MKYLWILLTGLALLISCTGQEGNGEAAANPEEHAHDRDSEQAGSLKPQFKPDTTIGQISLVNSQNVDSYLGEDVMERLVDEELLASSVMSADSTQRLKFYFHPGGVGKEFSEFMVSYADPESSNEFITTDKEFVTESGIKLGITMEDLRSIKGEPDSMTNGETTIFHYRIDDLKSSGFLKRYNMPVYYADYEFKSGYLNEFRFGFEYP